MSETLVWGGARDPEGAIDIVALSKGEVGLLRPRVLIVATGAFERPIMASGRTLPGVMTARAARTLARSFGVAPGRRIVVGGDGPLNFQVASELAAMGCSVTVVEAEARWKCPLAGFALALADVRLAWRGLAGCRWAPAVAAFDRLGRIASSRTSR